MTVTWGNSHGMMMSDQTNVNDDGNKDHQVGDTSC